VVLDGRERQAPEGKTQRAIHREGGASVTTLIQSQLERVAAPLLAYRWRATEEKVVQDHIENIFRREGFTFEREARLSERDRPDFLIDGSLAVEVKIAHASGSLLSQIHRYAMHESVAGILVVTTSHRLALAMPSSRVRAVPGRL
jgi:hypothetical protein